MIGKLSATAGAVLLLAVVSTGSTGGTARQAQDVLPILYERGRLGSLDIYATDADGRRRVRVIAGSTDDVAPVWAPSGDRFAFTSSRSGSWQVWMKVLGATQPVQLTDGRGSSIDPAWSRDGSRIAFESNRLGNWDVWTMDASGANERSLTDSSLPEHDPAWRPDGMAVAFDRVERGRSDLFERDVATRAERQLTATTKAAEFNPDYDGFGTLLAFDRLEGTDYDVLVLELKSGRARRVAATTRDEFQPRFTSDGEAVLYTVSVGGQFELYRAPPDGKGRRVNITRSTSTNDSGPSWRPGTPTSRAATGRAALEPPPPPDFICTKWFRGGFHDPYYVRKGTKGVNGLCGSRTTTRHELRAYRGDDYLDGRDGKDRLRAGKGDDVLIAIDGYADILRGGDGVDLAWVDKSKDTDLSGLQTVYKP
jgi:Tol biopolymer transport system component